MKFLPLKIVPLAFFALAGSLGAQVLMLDFGSTTAADVDQSNSPYHTAGSFSGTSWNTLVNTDPGALTWADGTAATGISAAIGTGGATTAYAAVSDIDLDTNPSSVSGLGGAINTGIYEGSTAGKDGIFTAVTSGNAFSAVGLQIGGLTAGTYDIYITARNTSAAGHTQLLYAGRSADAGDFTYTGYDTQTLSYGGDTDFGTDAWTEGVNYAKFSVSITSGELLNIVSLGGSFQNRGFLNSVQIVSTIPEPSAFALLGGAGALALASLRRRQRAR
ncbi:MAG: PEP-CTERM sorting domain-containing protein [Verrucomicrobiota bacterium]